MIRNTLKQGERISLLKSNDVLLYTINPLVSRYQLSFVIGPT